VALVLLGGSVYFASYRTGASPSVGKLISKTVQQSQSIPLTALVTKEDPTTARQRRFAVGFLSTFGSGLSEDGNVTVVWHATLDLGIVENSKTGQTIQGRFSQFSVSIDTDKEGADSELHKLLLRSFTEPFLFNRSHQGVIDAVRLRNTVEPMPAAMLRSVLSALQFVKPNNSILTETWSTVEPDTLGTCETVYKRIGSGKFVRTKSKYDSIKSLSELVRHQKSKLENDSSGRFTLDESDEVREVESDEIIRIPLGDKAMVSSTKITIRLESSDVPLLFAHPDDLRLPGQPLWGENVPITASDLDKKEREQRANETTVQLATDRLLALDDRTDRDANDERHELQLKLAALFDHNSNAITDAQNAIRRRLSASTTRVLFGALGDSTRPESEAALVSLAKSADLDASIRQTALTQINLKDTTAPNTVQSLQKIATLSDNGVLKRSAVLALGSVSSSVSGEGAESARADANNVLRSGYESATSEEDKLLYLGAMGNSGDAVLAGDISKALEDESMTVRSQAIMSLRFVKTNEASAIITKTIINDTEPTVRSSALRAATFREESPEMIQAMTQALLHDTSTNVRLTALNSLRHVMNTDDTVLLQLLQQVADSDPSEDVRNTASAALADLSGQPPT
jgi:hypothetical protein